MRCHEGQGEMVFQGGSIQLLKANGSRNRRNVVSSDFYNVESLGTLANAVSLG